ncbi:MAG: hypothetical protein V7609_3102 [Verrucomicrobiota bacterium]
MAVTKTADADQAPAGSDVTYTITVSNNGPDSADNATLTDPLPAGTTFVSLSAPAGWTCSTPGVSSGGTVTCTYPTFPVTSGDVFTLVVNIPSNTSPGTTFTNQATVGTSTFDPTDENNTSSTATTVPGTNADMQVTKVASASEAFADSDITYTIQVNNFGPDVATNAELFDALPGNMTFLSLSSPAGWTCTTPAIGSGGSIVCTNPSFAAGASSTFTLKGHIPSGTSAGTTYNNTALASSSTSDPDSSNNNAITSTVVVACLTNPVVTSNADNGAGSLRQAIADACVGGTIIFDNSQVVSPIILTTAELYINKNLTITGPGANVLTVMRSAAGGTPNFRIFQIDGGPVAISGLTISNGKVVASLTAGSGGGILVNSGTLNIDGVVVSGNNAGDTSTGGSGGGLANISPGTLTVTNSTISGNICVGNAGGIFNVSSAKIINSTISNNRATFFGGGVFSGNSGSGLSVTNSTITNNRCDSDNTGAESGGGMAASTSTTVLLNNTIVAGNFKGTGTARDDLTGPYSNTSSYNLIGDGTGETGITNGSNGNHVGTSAAPINALLAALGNYGGPTPTHLLLPASPAIDAGLDPLAVDANGDALDSDQRGNPRSINNAVDIGAVEVDYAIDTTAGTPQSTAVNTAFPIALKATVTESGNPVSGISVTFTAPTSGARATFSSGNTATVVTDANGVATAPTLTANGTPGSYTVAATVIGIATPANFSLTNVVGATTHFSVTAPANATAGVPFNFTVNALDSGDNVVTNYTGTVRFTSNDPSATLPANSTLTNGTGTFSATLRTAGNRTITATDTSTAATGTSNTIVVAGAAATHFSVVAPANATAGTAFNFTVTALDQFNNTAAGYTGTVRFNSTDLNATLPANSTLANGTGTFSATLRTVGNQTITATDTNNSAINGTSNTIAVTKPTPGLSGTVSPTSGNVGTAFTDTAVLSGGVNPTGTITFTVYGPNAANCATAIFTSSKTVNGNGTYVSDSFTPTAPGSYTFVAFYSGDASNNPVSTVCGAASQTFTVTSPAPTPTPAQSLNISTRVRTELGDRAMIGGFIITGNAPKSVVIRGLGPSLASFNLSDLLPNPQLELKGPNNNLLFLNKDWKDSQRSLIEGTNFQPKDDRESVIVISLNPGAYTAILSGEGGTTGIGLVEVYDTSPNSDSKLGNISTRGFVQTGDKVMIGGFTLGANNNPTRIAIRGRGPSLSQFGLSPVLADPTLELRNQNGTILVVNDDWQSDPVSAANLTANGLGLSDPKEAGIFTSLPAGQFTAVLAGKTGGIGIGLIEIYNLQ